MFPIGTREKPCLRTGYRSVPLKNIYNETQELSSLLARERHQLTRAYSTQVHIEVSFGSSEEYQSLEEMRDQLRLQKSERDALIQQKVRGNSISQVRICMQYCGMCIQRLTARRTRRCA